MSFGRSGLLAMEASILKGDTPVGGAVIDAGRYQAPGFIAEYDREARPIPPPTVPVPVRESAFAVLGRYLLHYKFNPWWGRAGNRYPRAQTLTGMTFKVPTVTHNTARTPQYQRPKPRYTRVLPYPRPGELNLPKTYGPFGV